MFMWFSCTETYQLIVWTSSSLVIYWCWHIFVWKMFQNFNITFDYLVMLIIFHVQNVLIILDWCLCDFLVLKYIEVIYWCWHIFVWKMFQNFNIVFDYLLMLTYFSCAKCSYHFQLMFMWFSCTETYQLIVWTSSSLVIYWCWHILCGKCSRISILLLII